MDISKDKSIGSASVRVSRKITRILNVYLKPYNITAEQWGVLRTLNESDKISQKELAERADKDQATLTKILDLLEKNGFAERIPNPTDRRSFLITITEKGTELSQQLIPFIETVFEKFVHQIDEEKLAIYQEVLRSIERNIDALLENPNN
ncbi:MarR family winged helix-turn-helix transcriptional regulator [Thermaerobacillus caldiproteolyticus]|uniref:DNA-binding MarR family transcriptional regulator n=1 Tax=Thermaerobacillus caldiproteolyticus TaxID=247480 RepID=A0A7W0BWH2_9BACL|nr:MarR family transcriptional regulator [Anoxybacillus caldiproteolyticus]MBA2873396.1 DNA-binding MarR family transcriptional regulator [Anoxybacillus caldiproteolyticus]